MLLHYFIKLTKLIQTMFKQIIKKPKKLYITVLLLSATVFGVERQTNSAYAQYSRDYIRSSCHQAYDNYREYSNSSDTSTTNSMMTYQALNRVADCAIKYSQLVRQDPRYCSDALTYVNKISPIMLTAAATVQATCSR